MSIDVTRIEPSALDLKFYGDVYNLLDELPDNWVVTEGYRTMERSNGLYVAYKLHKGPRAAPGGLSPHNYGMAVDVALDGDPVKPGLQAIWITTNPAWQRLIKAIWKHPRLRSGYRYSDWPHIEKLNWKDYVAWRQYAEDNMAILKHNYPELKAA